MENTVYLKLKIAIYAAVSAHFKWQTKALDHQIKHLGNNLQCTLLSGNLGLLISMGLIYTITHELRYKNLQFCLCDTGLQKDSI